MIGVRQTEIDALVDGFADAVQELRTRFPLVHAEKMSVSSDKRKELADALAKAWSGYTADCLCVAVQDECAAERNYTALRKEVHSKASNVAVFRGILREQASYKPVVGVVCLNQESFRHNMWFGTLSNSFEKLLNNALMVMSDKGPYEFGFPKSPLTILDYALVGVRGDSRF